MDPKVFALAAEAGLSVSDYDATWEDITEDLKQSVESIKAGEIIQSSKFTLLDGMQAIELMDPKMDTCHGILKLKTLSQVINEKLLPDVEELSIGEISWLLDKLFISELMHYRGSNLGVSLLTCYYMHDPDKLLASSSVVFTAAQCLLYRLNLNRDVISLAGNYSDEEFVQYPFGFPIGAQYAHFSFQDITHFVDHVLGIEPTNFEHDKHNKEDAKALKKPKTTENEIVLPTLSEFDKILNKSPGIIARLKWNKYLHLVFSYLDRFEFDNVKSAIKSGIEALDEISNCTDQSTPPDPEKTHIFEYEMLKLISTAAPPLVKPWMDMNEYIKSWKGIFVEIEANLCSIKQIITSLRQAREFLRAMGDRKAELLVRSYALTLIAKQQQLADQIPLHLAAKQDCLYQFGINSKYIELDEKTSSKHFEIVGNAGLLDWLTNLAGSRARMRRTLPHLFEKWGTFFVDSLSLDNRLNRLAKNTTDEDIYNGFSRWHLDIVHDMIIEWIQTGFELNLYENYEMPMIFWYIDLLVCSQFQNVQLIAKQNEFMRLKSMQTALKRTAAKQYPKLKEITPPVTWYLLELEAKHLLTRGLFKYVAALNWAGYLQEPIHQLADSGARFYSRFRQLRQIDQPRYLTYEQYKSTYINVILNPSFNASSLLTSANESIKRATVLFKQVINFATENKGTTFSHSQSNPPLFVVSQAQLLLRTAIMNGIHLQKLISANTVFEHNKPQPKTQVKFDFETHPRYPIISIIESP